MVNRPNILMVDDKIENLIALQKVLGDLHVNFVLALSGNEALQKVLENEFAVALVDVQMPDMDGYETVALMRHEENTKFLPVIFVSAVYREDLHLIKGIETGAVDFISKPVIPEVMLGKVRVFLDLYKYRISLEEEIARRIQYEGELERHVRDLEQFKMITIDRELEIINLSAKINRLEERLQKRAEVTV